MTDYKLKYIKYRNKYFKLKNATTYDLKKNDTVLYIPTGENVKILAVHPDIHTPYYTIQMKNNTEKQTILSKLRKI